MKQSIQEWTKWNVWNTVFCFILEVDAFELLGGQLPANIYLFKVNNENTRKMCEYVQS